MLPSTPPTPPEDSDPGEPHGGASDGEEASAGAAGDEGGAGASGEQAGVAAGGDDAGLPDRDALTRIPIAERRSRVHGDDFASPPEPGGGFRAFFDSLPHILEAESLRTVVDAIAGAVRRDRAVVWMLGGHVVKTGLGPVLVDLMERGAVTHLALNGATAIHDYEACRWGSTSEDVAEGLVDGTFGMALETGRDLNRAVSRGHRAGRGFAEALAEDLASREDAAHPEHSLLLAARRLGVGATVHVAVGAEITHQHPEADGAAIGACSYRDFLTFSGALRDLDDGGVVLNVGSAVLLPEVFLKALSICRNLHQGRPRRFTAADFDMIRQYRPRVNVVERPTRTGDGEGFQITGHHEIMIPLLAWAVAGALEG